MSDFTPFGGSGKEHVNFLSASRATITYLLCSGVKKRKRVGMQLSRTGDENVPAVTVSGCELLPAVSNPNYLSLGLQVKEWWKYRQSHACSPTLGREYGLA